MKRRLISLFLTVAIFTMAGCSSDSSDASASDFTLNELNGEQISLNQFSGQPVLINFWALSCPDCIKEMPYIQAAYDNEHSVAMLTIAIQDSKEDLQAFMFDNGYTFPVLLDSNASVAIEYDVRFTPTTYFINSDGKITDIKLGPFLNQSELEFALKKLG